LIWLADAAPVNLRVTAPSSAAAIVIAQTASDPSYSIGSSRRWLRNDNLDFPKLTLNNYREFVIPLRLPIFAGWSGLLWLDGSLDDEPLLVIL
jgi:hypothetical protein